MGQFDIDLEGASIEDLESDFESILHLVETATYIDADLITLAILLAMYDAQRERPEGSIKDWMQKRAEGIIKALYEIANRSLEILGHEEVDRETRH